MIFCCALSESEIISRNERIEELIEKIGKQGIDAIDELYALISTDIYAYALSKVGNSHDAADIVQDTFIQIYRYAKAYTPQGKPLSWIFTIVANLANRLFLVQGRYTSFDEEPEEMPDHTHFERDVVDSEFLKQLMSTLRPDEQEVIVLHIVSGMKHIEISTLLDTPLSTVLSRYNRAIRKLQQKVKEDRV